MKMICTENCEGKLHLTVGKGYTGEKMDVATYEVHEQLPTVGGYVRVENDFGRVQAYHAGYFSVESEEGK